MHAAPFVAKEVDDLHEFVLADMPERVLEIGDSGFQEGIDRGALWVARQPDARRFRERRGELRLELLAQLPLKIRIALKAELGDETQHRRGADLRARGEF